MPKDNIDRAIKKASGADAENYDQVRYEGYGPGGIAVIVEALTDNRNRTASNVRSIFTKGGGALGETGSVSFSFDHVGEIIYPLSAGDADKVMEAAIDAGADDVETDEEGHYIYCAFESINEVSKALEAQLGEASTVKAIWRAAELDPGRRGTRAVADEDDGFARRRRRRAECLYQHGHSRGRHGQAVGLTPIWLKNKPGARDRSGLFHAALRTIVIEAGEEFDRSQPRIDIVNRHGDDQLVGLVSWMKSVEFRLRRLRRADDRILQRVFDIHLFALGPDARPYRRPAWGNSRASLRRRLMNCSWAEVK